MRATRSLTHIMAIRLGRRGAFLMFLALLDAVFAYSLVTPEPGIVAQQFPLLPKEAWAFLWGGTAVLCFFGAWTHRDRWAFTAAALIKTAWALRYIYFWYQGMLQAWLAVVVWLAFAATVLVISGWPEPIHVEKRPDPDLPEVKL